MSHSIEVRIMRWPGSEGVELPTYESDLAAGMDLHASVEGELRIEPGEIATVACGFAMALPEGWEAEVRPRSGLAVRHGIGIINSPGTIDADYRGQVMVPLINHGREAFVVTRNMRIAQMLIKPVWRTYWIEVDDLPETRRGVGGFGHTGV